MPEKVSDALHNLRLIGMWLKCVLQNTRTHLKNIFPYIFSMLHSFRLTNILVRYAHLIFFSFFYDRSLKLDHKFSSCKNLKIGPMAKVYPPMTVFVKVTLMIQRTFRRGLSSLTVFTAEGGCSEVIENQDRKVWVKLFHFLF